MRSEGVFLGALSGTDDLEGIRLAWDDFAAQTESQDVVHTSSERLPLYAQLWLLLTLLLMLTAEWAIRRAGGGR